MVRSDGWLIKTPMIKEGLATQVRRRFRNCQFKLPSIHCTKFQQRILSRKVSYTLPPFHRPPFHTSKGDGMCLISGVSALAWPSKWGQNSWAFFAYKRHTHDVRIFPFFGFVVLLACFGAATKMFVPWSSPCQDGSRVKFPTLLVTFTLPLYRYFVFLLCFFHTQYHCELHACYVWLMNRSYTLKNRTSGCSKLLFTSLWHSISLNNICRLNNNIKM